MALSIGLDTARSSLAATGEQIAVVSRNIARIGDPDAVRKVARVVTGPGSSVHIAKIDRSSDSQLLEKFLSSKSGASKQSEIYSALGTLETALGDMTLERSPAALLAGLGSALQKFSAAPNNPSAASAVVGAAQDLAASLNEMSISADKLRQNADSAIADSVDRTNNLLARLKELNDQVVQGTHSGTDVTDSMDAREGLLKQLSAELGINTLSRSNGDIAIFTESGITLFDRVPRVLSFRASPSLPSGSTGSAVYADGVPIAGAQHVLGVSNGRIAGLVSVRDALVPAFQRQLDGMAQALISAFAETDQSASPSLPPATGLFDYPGGPTIPLATSSIPGLAGSIKVNPRVVASAGGNPLLIRDGGIGGNPAYIYNPSGDAAFTDRIEGLIDKLDQPNSFDPSGEIPSNVSLVTYAKNSVSWLEQLRQSAKSEVDYRNAISERAQASLSKDTGVSLDEEMTNMLELERTFQASSRLIAAVDSILETLISAVR